MNRHTILPSLALVLAFSAQPLNAAKKPSSNAPDNQSNQTELGDPPTPLEVQMRQKRIKHSEHLALKGADKEFLNSPQGIAFKNQLASLDQEINAIYEKYLNVFRESPATEKGKSLRAERDRQLQLLEQKREKTEADYEKLKENSPAYRAMVKQHEKSKLSKYGKNPLKPNPASEEKSEDKQ